MAVIFIIFLLASVLIEFFALCQPFRLVSQFPFFLLETVETPQPELFLIFLYL